MTAFHQRVFSGVQPTGNLHLGNYLGAIRALRRPAGELRVHLLRRRHARDHRVAGPGRADARNIREVTAAFIAAGIDPKKHIVFNQSQVAEHAELAWVFNCVARIGWLNRMTQFKEKAGKDRENASVGLYAYPSADGRRHPGLPRHARAGRRGPEAASRAVARHRAEVQQRLRRLDRGRAGIGDAFFPLPEPLIQGPAPRVMSLRDGTKKMSKSDPSDYSRINFTDDADAIAQKIRKAKTDPEPLPSEAAGLAGRPGGRQPRPHLRALADVPRDAGARRVRRRPVLGLQAGARRPRGREARPDQRRDEAAAGRSGPYRRHPRATAPSAPRAIAAPVMRDGEGHRRLHPRLSAGAATASACSRCVVADSIAILRSGGPARPGSRPDDGDAATLLRGGPPAEVPRRRRRDAGMRPGGVLRRPPRRPRRRRTWCCSRVVAPPRFPALARRRRRHAGRGRGGGARSRSRPRRRGSARSPGIEPETRGARPASRPRRSSP